MMKNVTDALCAEGMMVESKYYSRRFLTSYLAMKINNNQCSNSYGDIVNSFVDSLYNYTLQGTHMATLNILEEVDLNNFHETYREIFESSQLERTGKP